MIKVNGKVFTVDYFPDGTQCLMHVDITPDFNNKFNIFWRYKKDEELVTLMYIVNYIRNSYKDKNVIINLYMPYIPNARMDRTKNNNEIFTLKFFANFINSLNFDKVSVLDPHSDVSVALINRISIIDINSVISNVIAAVKRDADNDNKELVIYFPDAGAYKRYKDLGCIMGFRKCYGHKDRDWLTGKIVGMSVVDENDDKLCDSIVTDFETASINGESLVASAVVKPFENKYVLMIDDIISYGGTFYYSAKKINELGADKIYAYATHVETDSFWDNERGTFKKAMGFEGNSYHSDKQIVEKLYTTNSLYDVDENYFVELIDIENLK